MALESERVYTVVQDRLAADATLNALLAAGASGYHRDVAPLGTAMPFVVIGTPVATDAQLFNTARHWQDCLILTKVCGTAAQRLTLRQAADRIDTLLQEYQASVEDGVLTTKFRREAAPALDPERLAGGVVYVQLAQLYRTEAYPA